MIVSLIGCAIAFATYWMGYSAGQRRARRDQERRP